jgi:hypothetical protein
MFKFNCPSLLATPSTQPVLVVLKAQSTLTRAQISATLTMAEEGAKAISTSSCEIRFAAPRLTLIDKSFIQTATTTRHKQRHGT